MAARPEGAGRNSSNGCEVCKVTLFGHFDGGRPTQATVPHHEAAVTSCADEAIVDGQSLPFGALANLSCQYRANDQPQSPVDPTSQTGDHSHGCCGTGIGCASEFDGFPNDAVNSRCQCKGMAQDKHEGRLKREHQ